MAIIFLRVIILYSFVILSMRLLGKRQLGELEPSELVLTMLISEFAAVPIQEPEIPLLYGILPIFILLCFSLLISQLMVKYLKFREFLGGKSSIIVKDGVILQAEMAKNRFTVDELLEEMRMQGIIDISAVKYAILETCGHISIIPYSAKQPPTAEAMNLNPHDLSLPRIIINGGKLQKEALHDSNFDKTWLLKQLSSRGISHISDVFLMTVDDEGKIYISLKAVQQ